MMNEACAADLGPLIGLILTCIIVAILAIIATRPFMIYGHRLGCDLNSAGPFRRPVPFLGRFLPWRPSQSAHSNQPSLLRERPVGPRCRTLTRVRRATPLNINATRSGSRQKAAPGLIDPAARHAFEQNLLPRLSGLNVLPQPAHGLGAHFKLCLSRHFVEQYCRCVSRHFSGAENISPQHFRQLSH